MLSFSLFFLGGVYFSHWVPNLHQIPIALSYQSFKVWESLNQSSQIWDLEKSNSLENIKIAFSLFISNNDFEAEHFTLSIQLTINPFTCFSCGIFHVQGL